MALQKTFVYEEAGNIELTGAYHRVREVNIEFKSPALTTGDVAEMAEDKCWIDVEVFATSGVRHDTATPIAGYQFEFPLPSVGEFSNTDEIFTSAYNYLKTGHVNHENTFFYSGAVDV
jgi:hypothetical protein